MKTTKNDWIDVQTELPPEGEIVIATVSYDYGDPKIWVVQRDGDIYVRLVDINGNGAEYLPVNGKVKFGPTNGRVVAWMPLPKAKGSTEDEQ